MNTAETPHSKVVIMEQVRRGELKLKVVGPSFMDEANPEGYVLIGEGSPGIENHVTYLKDGSSMKPGLYNHERGRIYYAEKGSVFDYKLRLFDVKVWSASDESSGITTIQLTAEQIESCTDIEMDKVDYEPIDISDQVEKIPGLICIGFATEFPNMPTDTVGFHYTMPHEKLSACFLNTTSDLSQKSHNRLLYCRKDHALAKVMSHQKQGFLTANELTEWKILRLKIKAFIDDLFNCGSFVSSYNGLVNAEFYTNPTKTIFEEFKTAWNEVPAAIRSANHLPSGSFTGEELNEEDILVQVAGSKVTTIKDIEFQPTRKHNAYGNSTRSIRVEIAIDKKGFQPKQINIGRQTIKPGEVPGIVEAFNEVQPYGPKVRMIEAGPGIIQLIHSKPQ